MKWTAAAGLRPGDQLLTSGDIVAVVVAVRTWTGGQDRRNLTVDDTHTYYVIVGTTQVLVHNCPPTEYDKNL